LSVGTDTVRVKASAADRVRDANFDTLFSPSQREHRTGAPRLRGRAEVRPGRTIGVLDVNNSTWSPAISQFTLQIDAHTRGQTV